METVDDDLAVWIASLRGRIARGDLAGLDNIDLGDGTPSMPGELLTQIMLADFDHYKDLSPDMRQEPDMIWRWELLLRDLRRLRTIIG